MNQSTFKGIWVQPSTKLVCRCYNPTCMPKMSICYTRQTLIPVVVLKTTEIQRQGSEKMVFNQSLSNVTVGRVLRDSTVFKCAWDCWCPQSACSIYSRNHENTLFQLQSFYNCKMYRHIWQKQRVFHHIAWLATELTDDLWTNVVRDVNSAHWTSFSL